MRNRVFVTLGLFLLLAASSVYAQQKLTVDVPFDFMVGKRTLPAGAYEIDRDVAHQKIAFIHNLDNNTRSITSCQTVETTGPTEAAKLVFHRYGNRYFLSEIWEQASGIGRQLSPSAAEREMLARAGSYKTETVLARKRPLEK